MGCAHKIAKRRYQFYSEVDGWASGKALWAELAYNPLRVSAWRRVGWFRA